MFYIRGEKILKSAQDMVEMQRGCMREYIMRNIESNIKQGYKGFCTTIQRCPVWLQQELEALDYRVSIYGTCNDQVQILWWKEGE